MLRRPACSGCTRLLRKQNYQHTSSNLHHQSLMWPEERFEFPMKKAALKVWLLASPKAALMRWQAWLELPMKRRIGISNPMEAINR